MRVCVLVNRQERRLSHRMRQASCCSHQCHRQATMRRLSDYPIGMTTPLAGATVALTLTTQFSLV